MDLIGQRFARLLVVERLPNTTAGARRWRCRCDCGTLSTVTTGCLRSGNTNSCGCLARDLRRINAKHLMSQSPEHRAWTLMRNRCTNQNAPRFDRWGGRGITVCPAWNDFETFLRDMGPRPTPAHSLDRINNDGPYSPENCRWATRRQQANNTSTTRIIEHNGERRPLNEWARLAGINKSTFYYRLKRGLTMHEAMTRPLHERHG